MSENGDTVIDVRGLTKRFGEKTAVKDVDLKVRKGEIVGFLGPNGSGKTTTIRMICGLLRPDGGEGTCLGYDILRQAEEIKREVGYMTQRFSFYEDLTIRENLEFVARLYTLSDVRRTVDETVKGLGLKSRQHQLAGTLSGGWKQRLALAACIMHKPQLLLLDEPTAGVDPKARREFWDEIHRRAEDGLTVLVSTHYMDEAERCHRIVYIAYGTIVARGTAEEIIEHSRLGTFVVAGRGAAAAARALEGMPGVEQVAAFGQDIHVVGSDGPALERSVHEVAERFPVKVEPGETTLEDVFIRLMSDAQTSGSGR
jgi:ABC-2 type transport system ATP-binding protein